MRVLLAPDKLKACCTARAAADALARGFRSGWPEVELQLAPLADGGEGFAEAIRGAVGGNWERQLVTDPLGRPIEARYLFVEDRNLAIVEASEASGLARVSVEERQPVNSTSWGTGELILAARKRGAAKILVGIGGTATTDGGIGIATAIGFEVLDARGDEYCWQTGKLTDVATIRRPPRLQLPEIIGATDVRNPLLGTRGTARVYACQKGADQLAVELLEIGLTHLAQVVARDLGTDFASAAGAGAGGGIGFGLLSFCGAELRSGFDVVADYLGLEEMVRAADVVVTAEGRIDAQTAEGKAPAGVARLARKHRKPVIAFAGEVLENTLFDAAVSINGGRVRRDEALRRGEEFLEQAARRIARVLRVAGVEGLRCGEHEGLLIATKEETTDEVKGDKS